MKIINIIALISLSFLCYSCNQDVEMLVEADPSNGDDILWSEPKNGLKIGIHKRTSWKSNDTAKVTVFLKNISSKDISVSMFFFGLSALQLEIKDQSGELISFSKENLSTELGSPEVIKPNDFLTAIQSIVLTEDAWSGGTGNFIVRAVLDLSNDSATWSGQLTTDEQIFIVNK